MRKSLSVLVLFILIGGGFFFYRHYYDPSGEGSRSGLLVHFVQEGNFFKTYEGEMIQVGLHSYSGMPASAKSFRFSVTDKAVADSLLSCKGKEIVLHYNEYLGTLPWRGHSNCVVDKILFVTDVADSSGR